MSDEKLKPLETTGPENLKLLIDRLIDKAVCSQDPAEQSFLAEVATSLGLLQRENEMLRERAAATTVILKQSNEQLKSILRRMGVTEMLP